MDNVKVNFLKKELYIKKGIISTKYLYFYITYFVLIFTFFVIISLKKEDGLLNTSISNFLEKFSELIAIFLIFNTIIFITCIMIFLFSFLRNFHLEKIIIKEELIIIGINYFVKIPIQLLEKIEVTSLNRARYSFFNQGTYYSHFRDKCTIIFITKDERRYEWGYNLSYKKGMELKKIIEKRLVLIWEIGLQVDGTTIRGLEIDKALGNNLGATFKTFDNFNNGVARSVKSIDLNAKSYQNGMNLFYKLNKDLRAISKNLTDKKNKTLKKIKNNLEKMSKLAETPEKAIKNVYELNKMSKEIIEDMEVLEEW